MAVSERENSTKNFNSSVLDHHEQDVDEIRKNPLLECVKVADVFASIQERQGLDLSDLGPSWRLISTFGIPIQEYGPFLMKLNRMILTSERVFDQFCNGVFPCISGIDHEQKVAVVSDSTDRNTWIRTLLKYLDIQSISVKTNDIGTYAENPTRYLIFDAEGLDVDNVKAVVAVIKQCHTTLPAVVTDRLEVSMFGSVPKLPIAFNLQMLNKVFAERARQ